MTSANRAFQQEPKADRWELTALSARRDLAGVSDAHGAQSVVDEVAAEKDLPVELAVGGQRAKRLFAGGAGLLVCHGYGAARAGVGDAEGDVSDPNVAPFVLGVGAAASDDEVRPKSVHR